MRILIFLVFLSIACAWNDPEWGKAWHLHTASGERVRSDINVEDAWNAGHMGSGVVVGSTRIQLVSHNQVYH